MVVLEVSIRQLVNPVDHVIVLYLPASILSVHFGIGTVIIKEARVVLGVGWQLSVAKEVDHLFHLITDPGELFLRVVMYIRIVALSGILQGVSLSGLLAHSNDFFYSALSIRSRQVSLAKQEAHHVVKFGLWVHDQVLEPNEEGGHLTELGIVHHRLHPAIGS